MKRFLVLLLVALLTMAVLLFLFNPEILEKVWLWIVGLIGFIVASIRSLFEWFKNTFSKEEPKAAHEVEKIIEDGTFNKQQNNTSPHQFSQIEQKLVEDKATQSFKVSTLNLLRYSDDGKATLSLLFYNQKFFCYALEDTFHPVKIPGETRIPAGNYSLNFNSTTTPLTQKYRSQYPWFTHHLELKNVPNYSSVYLHVGNYHQDTEGCILIADGIGANNTEAMVTQSRQAFQRLYLQLKAELDQEIPVRIIVRDESWFTQHLVMNHQTLMPAL